MRRFLPLALLSWLAAPVAVSSAQRATPPIAEQVPKVDTIHGIVRTDPTERVDAAYDDAVRRLDVGGVMINDTSIFRADHMPYGGNRGSGLGREGVRFAVEEMTSLRMVVIAPA